MDCEGDGDVIIVVEHGHLNSIRFCIKEYCIHRCI
jgi:hypothetical protein